MTARLVCYSVEGCPPCRWLEPALDLVVREFGDQLDVERNDAWDDPEGVVRHQIMSLPTSILFIDGEERLRVTGACTPRQLTRRLTGHLRIARETRGTVRPVSTYRCSG